MPAVMGPVLAFQSCTDKVWNVSVLVVTHGEPFPITFSRGSKRETAPPEELWSLGRRTAFRCRLALPRQEGESEFSYQVDDQTYRVYVPASGASPRMAYTSCNGFSSLKLMRDVKDKNNLWKRMTERHEEAPYHLLLQGGDQVYADSIWETVPTMRAWSELPYEKGNASDVNEEMRDEIERFYFDLYTTRWAQPEVRRILAEVPGLRMWDDHDLIDGWGSYDADRQNCAVYGAIWAAARKAFAVFQQQLTDVEGFDGYIAPEHGFSFGHIVGKVAILALDMRSERTHDRVLSPEHWEHIYEWLDALPDGLDHLIVMSSIPVVYPGFDTLERLLGSVPGHWDLEDDLRDHWRSRPHKGERLRLIHRLLATAQQKMIRPTLLSGDVHVAALGLIESERHRCGDLPIAINQLISSGIVHPGPPAALLFTLRHLLDSKDEIDRGIVARMMEFPGNGPKFVGQRNFLSIEPDGPNGERRLWANWIVEREEHPYTKTIHALDAQTT